MRERVSFLLKQLGYQPSIQTELDCDDSGTCGEVKNVLARSGATSPAEVVLLTAHYDSVPAGPGACDDGAGVAAVLEIARAIKEDPPHRNGVVFLLDEGEEAGSSGSSPPGLRGARTFLDRHPWAREVRAIVNLEARGTSGPSIMFETSSDNGWLVGLLARSLRRPLTNSTLATIYARLATATDLSLYQRQKIPGVNFAFIGRAAQYHTELDRVENADLRSLQHQGDNALAITRALADADLHHPPPGDAVFFDVLCLFIVAWPAAWTVPLAGLTVALFGLLVGIAARRGAITGRPLGWAAIEWLAALGTTGVAAWALAAGLDAAGAFPTPWLASPGPALAAFLLIPLAVALVMRALTGARGPLPARWCLTWIVWAGLGCLLAVVAPGLAYLFVVPVLSAAAAGAPWLLRKGASPWRTALALAIPSATALVLWVPIIWLVHQALGAEALVLVALLTGLCLSTAPLALPLAGRWRSRSLALGGAAVFVAAILPLRSTAFTASSPPALNVVHFEDADQHSARWLIETDSTAVPGAAGPAFPWGSRPAFGWWVESVRSRPAPALGLPPPELQIEGLWAEGPGQRRIRGRLRSWRGASSVGLYFPPAARVVSFTMQGRRLPAVGDEVIRRQGGWTLYTCETVPAAGAEVEFLVEGPDFLPVFIIDRSPHFAAVAGQIRGALSTVASARDGGNATLVGRGTRL
jgi:hypothetical protein